MFISLSFWLVSLYHASHSPLTSVLRWRTEYGYMADTAAATLLDALRHIHRRSRPLRGCRGSGGASDHRDAVHAELLYKRHLFQFTHEMLADPGPGKAAPNLRAL